MWNGRMESEHGDRSVGTRANIIWLSGQEHGMIWRWECGLIHFLFIKFFVDQIISLTIFQKEIRTL